MRKIFVGMVFSLITVLPVLAQEYRIRGKVLDTGGESLEYVNVVLQTVDSTYVGGVSTNAKGDFLFPRIQPGDYQLSFSSIGYLPLVVALQGFSSHTELADIQLESESVMLEGVTVTADNMISRSDRKIVFPSEQQIAASTNGVNLLQTLMLPRLQVNPLTNAVSLQGNGEVQLRINGIKVAENEVVALQPSEIVRVEYLDNPGVRYENAEVVINYITRVRMKGGSVSADLLHSPHVVFGNDQLSARFNRNKSEFSVYYALNTRHFKEFWRSNEETFHFADGTELYRQEEGKPGRYTNQIHHTALTYTYQQPDKYLFQAAVKYIGNMEPHTDYNSELHTSETPGYTVVRNDMTDWKSHFPTLDLYYLHQLHNRQTVMFNLVGSYIHTQVAGTYRESVPEEVLTLITTGIRGKKYSVIGEGLYEKEFNTGRWSTGMKHTHSFSRNRYRGTVMTETDMKQSDTYLYSEYSGELRKLHYTLGMGVSRAWVQQEGEEGYETYNFRPRFSVGYRFSDHLRARLNGRIGTFSPSLSELSAVEQWIDNLQFRRGNPDLSPFRHYQADLYLEYRKGLFSGFATAQYQHMPNPVMDNIYREGSYFVHTYENQRRWEKVNSEMTARVGMLWKVLQFSVTGGVNKYFSKGVDYSHTYTNWYYRAEVLALYRKWVAVFNINSNWNHYWGEQVMGGENMHMLMVMYNHKSLSLGVGAMNPFSDNYKRVNENMNRYASSKSESYINESSRMFVIKLAWNFSFGREYRSGDKRLYNQDSNSGILQR